MRCDRLRNLSGRPSAIAMLLLACSLAGLTGCGTTKQTLATEQLVNSDAVDTAIARIDFTPLAGQRVYFDTKYIADYKGIGFVNSNYVISSLRQQMLAAGLLLEEKLEDADYVVEGRVGALGIDDHDVVYGIPSNSAVSAGVSAASSYSGMPMPTIPELSVARRNSQIGAAKIGVFAYNRETKEAVWQSGISVARSTAKDFWFLGIGPFQDGHIYSGHLRFAGDALDEGERRRREGLNGPIAAYREEMVFQTPGRKADASAVAEERKGEQSVQQASGETVEKTVQPVQGTARLPGGSGLE